MLMTTPCQHRDSTQELGLFAKSAIKLTPFNTPAAFAEEATSTLSWSDLQGLDYDTGKSTPAIGRFDGKTVSIPGYAVPIAGDSEEKITEFLLVPEPMMCIHVPPPPPNQLVHVRLKTPGPVKSFVPLLVSGRLKIVKTKSEYGNAGYQMEGIRIADYKEQ